jgi:TPR repeat protein
MFKQWIYSDDPQPYNSFGNGAAMRVSPAAFAAESLEEALELAETVTAVTHNHEEGIKGAKVVTKAIYLALMDYYMYDIRDVINKDYYPMDFCIDDIRPSYQFNETCQETVPQAIMCFVESWTFEDAIRNAVSLGGDTDTICAITGAIAEAFYKWYVPEEIKDKALSYLDDELRGIYDEWVDFIKTMIKREKTGFPSGLRIQRKSSYARKKRYNVPAVGIVLDGSEFYPNDYDYLLDTWDMEKLQKAADEGDADAQFELGNRYCFVKNELEKAFIWYEKAAKQDHVKALSVVAECYFTGAGVKLSWEKGFPWCKKAAEMGCSARQMHMGFFYEDGDYVEKDIEEAIYWYKKAAQGEQVHALLRLAAIYLRKQESDSDDYDGSRIAINAYVKVLERNISEAYYLLPTYEDYDDDVDDDIDDDDIETCQQ